MSESEEHRAEVVPLRARDIHYELALDAEPGAPVPVGETDSGAGDERLPVVPPWMRPANLAHSAARARHGALAHGLRVPQYLFWTAVWAPVGAVKLAWRVIFWWHLLEAHSLKSEAVAAGDAREYRSLHRDGRETRKVRGLFLLGGLAGALIAGVVLVHRFGLRADAALITLAVVAVPWLAHYGRPADRPILRPVTTTARFRVLNADIVLRAYYAAGLGHPDKDGQQITFGSAMSRDGEGSRVLVDLPYGKSLKEAMPAKDSIASGLDVTESQVYLHRDPTSARRHTLWVADRDPLAVPVGRTPLLACKQTDVWKPAPLGLDERGQLVRVPLMWNSLLVGALPRQGKTFAARVLALYAALDPHCRLDVFDGKGSPDWRKFALVADSFSFGLTPTRDGLPPEILLQSLEGIRADVQDRYHRLSELPPDICPEGKLTRQIARDPRLRMPVRLLVIDEVQEYYDLGKISDQIADLLAFLVKVAPGAGVSLIASTQRPSGIGGSGNVQQRFLATRDNFQLRFSLRTSDYRVSEMVLGAGAYGEGLDSSKLLPQYKGVGILRGASDASPTVRTYLADGKDAEKILTAARALRERAGTLSGMALGETAPAQPSVLADVLAVLGEETAVQWETLAQLLAQRFPARHSDVTAESVSAQCRAAGVPSVDVKRQGRSAMGCRREHIEAALRERAP